MYRVLALVLGLAVGFVGLTAPAVAQSGYAPDEEESAFLGLINSYRAQNGLGPLVLNTALGSAAEHHSQDMATHDYFAHTLANGTDAGQNIFNFGYTGVTWSENIAAGHALASDTMIAWQNSSGHNANMLDAAFDEIGIGRAYDANSTYGWYWTTTFGGSGGAAPMNDSVESDTSGAQQGGNGESATWTWTTTSEDGAGADEATEPAAQAESCGEYVGAYC